MPLRKILNQMACIFFSRTTPPENEEMIPLAETLQEEAEELYARKEYAACVALIRNTINMGTSNVELHRVYAESLFHLREFEESLPSFQICLRQVAHSCKADFIHKAISASDKANLSPVEKETFWRNSSEFVTVFFKNAREQLLRGDATAAHEHFCQGVQSVFTHDPTAQIWIESFSFIVNAFSGKEFFFSVPEHKNVKKIMVSGMGWSGSGAIYDYFSEYDAVTSIMTEPFYIEGTPGVKGIIESSHNKEKCITSILDFFFCTLLGYGEITSANSLRAIRKARAIMKNRSFLYASDARCITFFLAKCLAEAVETGCVQHNTIRILATEIVDRLFADCAEDNGYILINNMIHIQNIELATYLSDIDIFCTFRDPRSNYVSFIREYKAFNDSIDEYINNRKQRLIKISKKLPDVIQETKNNNNNVRIFSVEFENFIMSEAYRDNFAYAVGLNPSKRTKFKKFKPWESMRNVVLHQEHTRPEEIKKIEEELWEYCREPCFLPLKR